MQNHRSDEVVVNLVVPRDLRVRLKELAARTETPVRRLAIQAFEDLLARGQPEGPQGAS